MEIEPGRNQEGNLNFLEWIENENTMYPNLWNTMKASYEEGLQN